MAVFWNNPVTNLQQAAGVDLDPNKYRGPDPDVLKAGETNLCKTSRFILAPHIGIWNSVVGYADIFVC
jgi:hypothetical protein